MARIMFVCTVVILSGCQISAGHDARSVHKNDASLVEACLQQNFCAAISKDIPLIIEENLSVLSTAGLVLSAKKRGNNFEEAAKSLVKNNAGSCTIDSLGELSVRHVVLKNEEYEALFRTDSKDGWEEFYKIYRESPGIITLSRPGFSRDRTVAMIYLGNQRNWLSGRGGIHVFLKTNGKWMDSGIIGRNYIS